MRHISVFLLLLHALACGDAVRPSLVGATPLPEDGGTPAPTVGTEMLLVGGVSLFVAGADSKGNPQPLEPDALRVECGELPCAIGRTQQYAGNDRGMFVLLVDGSGSNEAEDASNCLGCPTDPQRRRVEAVQQFVGTLYQHAPNWQGAIMQFGPSSSEGFRVTNNLSGYTHEPEVLQSAAAQLSSEGGTPLWDSLSEVLDSLEAESRRNFGAGSAAGRQLIVISDGEDTDSSAHPEDVVAKARRMGIRIHAVGFGAPGGQAGIPIMSAQAIGGLRRVAHETGGVCSIIQADALPALFEDLARATVAGYVEADVGFHGKPLPRAGVGGTLHGEADEAPPFFVPMPFIY